jgi:DNA repair photolyase
MADSTTRPLDLVSVGDNVIGTIKRGDYRRFTTTQVLDCWSTEKPAYRVTLTDGTVLVASGDHRLLSTRGWKFVTDAERGALQRPHLTTKNRLRGTGAFATPPKKDEDYERGYLCGMIRGDGSLGFYQYERPGRSHGNQWRFRLALTDRDALMRSREYLAHFSVPTDVFTYQQPQGNWRAAHAIRTSAREHVETVQKIIRWPDQQSAEWCKGFLAGIFDAEGSTAGGSLRISNTDPAIIDCIVCCLKRFDFALVLEHPKRTSGKPITCVRVLGGLRERLRFFHSVEPIIARKQSIDGLMLKGVNASVVSIEPLAARRLFDVATGTGDFIANGIVSHNCYARRTHWFLEEDGVEEWSSKIFVKINAAEILRSELRRPSWKREEVALGTATDPYQSLERKYRVTRQILEALCEARTPVSIVTRSPMVIRDLDILTELARRASVTVCVSIATTDPRIAREIEPTVALPEHRLRTVRRLSEAGIRAGVILAPVLPGLTDDAASLDAVVQAARDHGAHFVSHRVLYLGDVTRQSFFKFLDARHPSLVPRYLRTYRGKYAPDSYTTKVGEVIDASKKQHGIGARRHLAPPPEPAQLPLFGGPAAPR